MDEWEVLMLGSFNGHFWELSVIKKDNEFGHESFGWDGMDKIIVFDDGSMPYPTADDKLQMVEIVNKMCNGLNL